MSQPEINPHSTTTNLFVRIEHGIEHKIGEVEQAIAKFFEELKSHGHNHVSAHTDTSNHSTLSDGTPFQAVPAQSPVLEIPIIPAGEPAVTPTA